MKNGLKLLLLGSLLCNVIACRSDKPPALSLICLGDGFGGADCITSSGERVYKKPSELVNFWMTTQVDMQNFASWCYDADTGTVGERMQKVAAEVSPLGAGEGG